MSRDYTNKTASEIMLNVQQSYFDDMDGFSNYTENLEEALLTMYALATGNEWPGNGYKLHYHSDRETHPDFNYKVKL